LFWGCSQQRKTRQTIGGLEEITWLPFLNTYRTMCIAPDAKFRAVLAAVRSLATAA
jgi:hypothetical protein